jgi:alpha,alpha-trehalase
MRESGHDTTYRLDGRCAHVATVDLNSLLYKYEVDIARMLEEVAGVEGDEGIEDDMSFVPECFQHAIWKSNWWLGEAEKRKKAMDRWLWNEEASCYYDWDFVRGEPVVYESATAFWPIWAGAASGEQRDRLLTTLLPQLEMPGGLVAGSLASRGSVSLDRPPRQWDYPFGWAPHQILFWLGLKESHPALVARVAYRWLWTAVYAYTNYHGVVPEKFDVARRTHRLTGPVEYGNVGTCFGMLAREGFGWMNASLLVGLSVLGRRERRALGALIEPEQLFAHDNGNADMS